MLSSPIYFALLQVACALSINRESNNQARSAPLQSRSLTTNEKVAIGICIPGAALVLLLGLVVLCMYPAQTRKLRKQNPGAHIGFAEVMAGGVSRRQPPPPSYKEHDANSVNDVPLQDLNATAQPTATQPPPATEARVTQQQAPAEARHALALG